MPPRSSGAMIHDQVVDAQPLPRLRSDGVLSSTELARYRSAGVPLLYDPVQVGWVPADVIDELFDDPGVEPPRHASRRDVAGDHLGGHASPNTELRFRRWQASDAERFLELLDNPSLWRYLPEEYPAPLTRADADDLIFIANQMPHHEVRALIFEGLPVGQVRILFLSNREAEVSYWLGQAYWGRGIMSRALGAYVEDVFLRYPELRSLVAKIHPDNTGSRRAALRAGFIDGGEEQGQLLMYRRRTIGAGDRPETSHPRAPD